MKQKIGLLILGAMLLTLFSACSAEDSFGVRSPQAPGAANYAGDSGSAGLNSYAMSDSEPMTFREMATELSEPEADRKIIWNASMQIEAEDAALLHDRLATHAAGLGGYEYANEIQHYEAYSVVRATYKVPPERLRAFMDYAGEQAKVINSVLSSDDVTEGYYDAQIRLDTKRKSLDRYYELLSNAASVEEILQLQRIIDGITEEIETLEGRLRRWDVLTDMATVSVLIRQENDPIQIRREINWGALSFGDMGYLIQSGFVGVTSVAFTVLQWIVIIVLVTSPLWVAVLVILWFVWWRPRRKRRAAARAAQVTAPPSGE